MLCGLLFAATAINSVDRQMISVPTPLLQADLGPDDRMFHYMGQEGALAYRAGERCGGDLAAAEVERTVETLASLEFDAARAQFAELGEAECGFFPLASVSMPGTWKLSTSSWGIKPSGETPTCSTAFDTRVTRGRATGRAGGITQLGRVS